MSDETLNSEAVRSDAAASSTARATLRARVLMCYDQDGGEEWEDYTFDASLNGLLGLLSTLGRDSVVGRAQIELVRPGP